MGLPTRQSGAGGTLRELTNADKHLGARQTGPPKSNFFFCQWRQQKSVLAFFALHH